MFERLSKLIKSNIDLRSCSHIFNNASINLTTLLILTTQRLIFINKLETNQIEITNISFRVVKRTDFLHQMINMISIQHFHINSRMFISQFVLNSSIIIRLNLHHNHCLRISF